MEARKYNVTWKSYILLVVGIAAFVIYIYIFNVDIQKIIATAQHIDVSVYAMAAFFSVLNILFFSLCWYFLLDFLAVNLSFVRSFLYVWYGIFIDAIIPGESVSGEVTKLYLITRDDNKVGGKVVASLVAQRLLGMGVNVISLLVGISLLLTLGQVSGIILNLTIFLAAGISILSGLLVLLCVKERWTLRIVIGGISIVERIGRGHWKLTKLREEVSAAARMFHDSMRDFRRSPKTLFAALSSHAIAWVFDLGLIYLVFLAVGYASINWGVVIITYSVLVSIRSIPVGIPFEAGLPEIAMSSLFIGLGVPPATSFAVTIFSRILTMWMRFFIGFGVQQWIEIKQAKLSAASSKIMVSEPKKV